MPIAEAAVTGLLINALKKPLEDLYSSAKGGTKERLQWLKASSALNKIRGSIVEIGTTRTITSRQPISILSIYYPARIKTNRGSMKIDTVSDLSDGANNHILITGTVGQGKSVFLKYLSIKEIENGHGIPLFIELRNISEKSSLISLLKTQLKHLGFDTTEDNNLFELLLSRELITLFLDGYDEVKKNFAESTQAEIKNLASSYPKLKIILSSRPSAISLQLDKLSGFSHLEIEPLKASDFNPFLTKIGVPQEARDRLIQAIKNSNTDIRQLITTPLMLTLVVTACGTRPSLPETLPDFYQSLFGVMVATHDETKPGYIREKATKLSNFQLENLFKAFCFITKDSVGTTSLTSNEFSFSHNKAAEITESNCSADEFKTDLIDVVCLMAKDGLNVAFIHKSIQEYFASAFISELDDDEVVKKIYENMRHSYFSEWTQELAFLEAIDNHRYKKYYLIPSIKKQLDLFNFNPTSKIGATIKDINLALKNIDPSISTDHEFENLNIGISVSYMEMNGVRSCVFKVFKNILEIFQSRKFETPIDADFSIDLADLLPNNIPRKDLFYKTIRQNLKNLHQEKVILEKEVENRREKLLHLIKNKKSKSLKSSP